MITFFAIISKTTECKKIESFARKEEIKLKKLFNREYTKGFIFNEENNNIDTSIYDIGINIKG